LYQVLKRYEDYLIKDFNISLRKALTTPQLSMQIFRSGFLTEPLPNYVSREPDIRLAYYGGRVEIFNKVGADLHYYDVNSLYPWVMATQEMPVGLPIKSFAMKVSDFGIAYCKIKCPKMYLPLLPFRLKNKTGYKLVFPVGTWEGWYCTPMLQKAKKLGYEIEIMHGYKFQKKILFKKFIDKFYKIKQNSVKDSVEYMNAKLQMNSLYGKFGQRRETEQIVVNPKNTLHMKPLDDFGNTAYWTTKGVSQAKHILPAIAAFVTCHAQLKLYEYMEMAVAKGGTLYYCDTDSLITNVKLETDNELGGIKNEIPEGITAAVFLLPKVYAIQTPNKEIIRCKGFPRGIFNYKLFKQAFDDDDTSKIFYKTNKFASPFESQRRNHTWLSMIEWSRTIKTKYDKRKSINPVETEPIELLDGKIAENAHKRNIYIEAPLIKSRNHTNVIYSEERKQNDKQKFGKVQEVWVT
jgi:hypothetical protein